MLESMKHNYSTFVTLTYDDEHLPKGGTVVPKHGRNFIKRLAKEIAPERIRYFFVGEYGDDTARPHYHCAIFGFQSCLRGRTNHLLHKRGRCCTQCNLLQKMWSHGAVDLGELNQDSAQYVCGYVTKKLTNKNDPKVQEWLKGRHPEFARMSLKPGIGATAAEDIRDSLQGLLPDDDVPMALKHGRRSWPLGRYLRSKVRQAFGMEETGTPKEALSKLSKEMSDLYEAYLDKPENHSKSFKTFLNDMNHQKILNREKKWKLYKSKGSL